MCTCTYMYLQYRYVRFPFRVTLFLCLLFSPPLSIVHQFTFDYMHITVM